MDKIPCGIWSDSLCSEFTSLWCQLYFSFFEIDKVPYNLRIVDRVPELETIIVSFDLLKIVKILIAPENYFLINKLTHTKVQQCLSRTLSHTPLWNNSCRFYMKLESQDKLLMFSFNNIYLKTEKTYTF